MQHNIYLYIMVSADTIATFIDVPLFFSPDV